MTPKPKLKPDWLSSLMNQWELKTNDKSAGKRVWTSPVTTDTDNSHDVLNQHTALLVYHKQNPFLSTRLCFLVLNVDYNATLKFNCLFSVKLLIVISFFQCRWFLSRAIFFFNVWSTARWRQNTLPIQTFFFKLALFPTAEIIL